MNLHPALPQHFQSTEEVRTFLQKTAQSIGTDTVREYFNPEDIAEFEHESSKNGREINRLKDIAKLVTDYCNKGNFSMDPDVPAKEITIVIPVTLGSKTLEAHRRQNDDNIEKGYTEIETKVYQIPWFENESMEYFTEMGDHIPERSRGMSAKEKHTHKGMFQLKAVPEGVVNTGTGELREAL